MADKKKSFAVGAGITPKCVLIFPYLNKPDTKFNAEGEFRTKAKFEGEAAVTIVELLTGYYDKAIAAMVEELKGKAKTPELAKKITEKSIKRAADKPWKDELDDETGEPTGNVIVSFKQKAQITGKDGTVYKKRVDLFDVAGKKFPIEKLIYGGSTAKLAYEALPFYTPALGAGLTLRLKAAQIIDLRTNGPKNADEYGFGSEGDGLPEEELSDGEQDTPAEGAGDSTDDSPDF
jgi:hypothetical protein